MSSYNRITLLGNLGQDPKIDTLNGTQKASFNIATETYYMQNGVSNSKTEWHKVVLWGNLAETARKYLKKGSPVLVEGKGVSYSFEDTSGVKRKSYEVHASSLILVGCKKCQDDKINQELDS